MNLRGKQSEKQELKLVLAKAYSKAQSEKHFYQLLERAGLTLYRHGKHIGIAGKRRHRLQTLGYSKERIALLELDKTKRERELTRLTQMKQKQKQQQQELDLEQEL